MDEWRVESREVEVWGQCGECSGEVGRWVGAWVASLFSFSQNIATCDMEHAVGKLECLPELTCSYFVVF